MSLRRRIGSSRRCACAGPLTRGVYPSGNHVRELAQRPHEHPGRARPRMCVPGGKTEPSSGQLTPCSRWILQLPTSYRYVPGDYTLFPPLARLADRSANSSRVIDVTGSWLSNRSGDLLSRYPFARWVLPYLRSPESIAETYYFYIIASR